MCTRSNPRRLYQWVTELLLYAFLVCCVIGAALGMSTASKVCASMVRNVPLCPGATALRRSETGAQPVDPQLRHDIAHIWRWVHPHNGLNHLRAR